MTARREMMQDQMLRLVVGEESAGRLDSYLAARTELSRSRIARLVEEGHVLVNGSSARKRDCPRPGDVIEVRLPAPESSWLEPEAMPLAVVYEDAHLAVVDKPSGLVVHPAPGHRSGTLVHGLLHRLDDLSGIGGVLRPGIVHRLDKDTSGLLVVAKTDRAHRALADELRRREIRRRYLALAWGHVDRERFTVNAPLGRRPKHRKQMAVVEGGRSAETHFERLERWPAADLLRVEIKTGRTHQIRVHLLHTGHPVVGDPIYAPERERGFSGTSRPWAHALARRVPRLFLHAAHLTLTHPQTGATMEFEAPLPPDLAAVVDWARSHAPDAA